MVNKLHFLLMQCDSLCNELFLRILTINKNLFADLSLVRIVIQNF